MTGVQTCALPISPVNAEGAPTSIALPEGEGGSSQPGFQAPLAPINTAPLESGGETVEDVPVRVLGEQFAPLPEIGRASCRERV